MKLTIEADVPLVNDHVSERENRGQRNLDEYEKFLNTMDDKRTFMGKKTYKMCLPSSPSSKAGAFGSIEVDTSKRVIRRSSYLINTSIIFETIFEEFYMPRLKNYCIDVTKYVKGVRSLFPNNFMRFKNCRYCRSHRTIYNKVLDRDLKVVYDMENASFSKANTDNFSEELSKGIYTEDQIASLFIQLYYISILCNRSGFFHNDMKAANIVINKAIKNFKYTGLGDIVIHVKKGDLIPILVDYDLVSFEVLDENHPASGTSLDFSFFVMKIPNKIALRFLDILSLPDFKEEVDSNFIRYVFRKYMPNVE